MRLAVPDGAAANGGTSMLYVFFVMNDMKSTSMMRLVVPVVPPRMEEHRGYTETG